MNREQVIATLCVHETELRRRGVMHAALFGSVARNEAMPTSDIDIMIALEPEAPVGLFEYVDITQYLADLFPNHVDVANRGRLARHSCGQVPSETPYMSSDRSRCVVFDIRDDAGQARDFAASRFRGIRSIRHPNVMTVRMG